MIDIDRSSAALAPAEAHRFALTLDVVIRPAARGDLDALEWYGQFTAHREIIDQAFARQERGENLMLLAVANDFPVGQAWVDLTVRADEGAGVLWAVRVFPFLQGLGLGARLLATAEESLRERGFAFAEIGVEKDNAGARRLYERAGYRLHRELLEEYEVTGPDGTRVRVPVDQWMLRKDLRAGDVQAALAAAAANGRTREIG
jgi:ribosomal protein S18 acetylase RimI-like enzyme